MMAANDNINLDRPFAVSREAALLDDYAREVDHALTRITDDWPGLDQNPVLQELWGILREKYLPDYGPDWEWRNG
jgi:hypothetical protein